MRWFLAALLLLGAVGVAVSSEPAAAAEHQVSITDTAYEPATITVTTADDIVWCNDGTTDHTVTADNGKFDSEELPATQDDDACFGGPASAIGPGTYPYHCSIQGHTHTGTLIVEAAPTTTTTSAAATTTAVAGSASTARPTATTRRTTTTKPVLRRSVTTRPATTSTTVAESTTTTSFFETTTSELTTTTFGSFAITESDGGGNGGTVAAVLLGLGVLGGAGYLGYRNRYRFMR